LEELGSLPLFSKNQWGAFWFHGRDGLATALCSEHLTSFDELSSAKSSDSMMLDVFCSMCMCGGHRSVLHCLPTTVTLLLKDTTARHQQSSGAVQCWLLHHHIGRCRVNHRCRVHAHEACTCFDRSSWMSDH